MKQQVNLYPPELRNEGKWPSGAFLVLVAILGFFSFCVFVGADVAQVYMTKLQVDAKEQQKRDIQEQVDILAGKALSKEDDAVFETKVVRPLKRRIAKKERQRELLRESVVTGVEGYSDFFLGLSKQAVPGVWLTELRIGGTGAEMSLTGKTTDGKLVPRYIERISAEPAFSDTRFKIYRLERVTAGKEATRDAEAVAATEEKDSVSPCCLFTVTAGGS